MIDRLFASRYASVLICFGSLLYAGYGNVVFLLVAVFGTGFSSSFLRNSWNFQNPWKGCFQWLYSAQDSLLYQPGMGIDRFFLKSSFSKILKFSTKSENVKIPEQECHLLPVLQIHSTIHHELNTKKLTLERMAD